MTVEEIKDMVRSAPGITEFQRRVYLALLDVPKGSCKKQVFDQQFSEKLVSADFGKQLLHILIDKAVMRQRAAASLLGA